MRPQTSLGLGAIASSKDQGAVSLPILWADAALSSVSALGVPSLPAANLPGPEDPFAEEL